jgi:curved DNA-binding protein CbpA
VLGVAPDCSEDELHAAHRALVFDLHPDRHQHLPEEDRRRAAERLVEVNLAWSLVDSPVKRAAHDSRDQARTQQRADRSRPAPHSEDPANSFSPGTWVGATWVYSLILPDGRSDVVQGPIAEDDERRGVAKAKLRTTLTDLSGLEAIAPADLDILYVQAPVRDSQLAHVARFPGLSQLSLVNSEVTASGLAALAHLNQLRRLDLGGAPMGDELGRVLASFPLLDTLELGATMVSDAIVPALLGLEHLEFVGLRGTKVTASGVMALADLPRLKSLTLSFRPRLQAKGQFRKVRPDVDVL